MVSLDSKGHSFIPRGYLSHSRSLRRYAVTTRRRSVTSSSSRLEPQVSHLPLTFLLLFVTLFLHSSQYHFTSRETTVSRDGTISPRKSTYF